MHLQGGQLETSIGSPAFMLLTAELMAVSQLLLVAVSWGAVQFQLLAPAYYFSHCTIGFSGVLFGYKTVATWLLPQQTGSLSGIPVPSKVTRSSSCGIAVLVPCTDSMWPQSACSAHSHQKPSTPCVKHEMRCREMVSTYEVPACSSSAGQSCCSYSWRIQKPPFWGISAEFWQVPSPHNLQASAPPWEKAVVAA